MPTLDLGFGNVLRGDVGLDSSQVAVDNALERGSIVYRVTLGFQRFPLADNKFDKVVAAHSLEHIPGVFYEKTPSGTSAIMHYPLVQVFNEVYRVLKHNGEFEIWVPSANSDGFKSDPTHQSSWTLNTINYFSGDYFHFHDLHGHTSNFKRIVAEMVEKDQVCHFLLKADKENKWSL